MNNTNLKIVGFKTLKAIETEKSIIEQLEESGFTATKLSEDAYSVKAHKTGALINARASERDLRDYVACVVYIKEKEGVYKSTNVTFPCLERNKE